AQFAGAVSTEKSRQQSGAALLDAVFADPGNLAARQVYGDWLVETGDPRGELIALQLANDPKTEGRRNALLKKHWKQWLGPLRDWFEEPPEFELGFPCAGKVSGSGSHADFRTALESPLWSTFRRLEIFSFGRTSIAEIATHRNLPLIAELGPVSVPQLRELAVIGHRGLEAVRVSAIGAGEPLEAKALRTLPKLRMLSITASTLSSVAPAIHELETLRFPWESPSTNFSDLLAACARIEGVRSLEFTFDSACTLRFTRGNHGFSHLEVPRVGRPLVFVLQTLPPTLESMTFAEPFPLTDAADQASVATSMQRFPQLKSPFVAKEKPTFDPHLTIVLRGVALGDPRKIPGVWKILTEGFGAKFDGFSVGYGTGFFELGDDPVARLVGRASKNAKTELRLKQRQGPTSFALLRDKESYTTGDLPLTDRERFCAAFDELIAFTKPSVLQVGSSMRSVRLSLSDFAKNRDAVRTFIMETK
ncbi:MAG: TIGR02996 domain-containing protein, partial [Archangium sp.]|nr:TIGR02996 domain-containing protein [Archangium sp.]